MDRVEQIAKSLRMTSDRFKDQIEAYVNACYIDMENKGIILQEQDDPLVSVVCELYCKAQFNYDGRGEWYLKQYQALRDNLSVTDRYM